jgi:hypothetical protein
MIDSKEAARAILFNRRYEVWEHREWQLFNYTLIDPDDQGRKYFLGLLIHLSHPHYAYIPGEFEEYIQKDKKSGKLIL